MYYLHRRNPRWPETIRDAVGGCAGHSRREAADERREETQGKLLRTSRFLDVHPLSLLLPLALVSTAAQQLVDVVVVSALLGCAFGVTPIRMHTFLPRRVIKTAVPSALNY